MNITSQVASISLEAGLNSFLQSFEAELNRVSYTLAHVGQEVEHDARTLLNNADVFSNSANQDTNDTAAEARIVEDLRAKAKSLSLRSVQHYQQTEADAQEFRRLAARADAALGAKEASLLVEARFESHPWNMLDQAGNGTIIVLLSDIYTVIRDLEEQIKLLSSGKDFETNGTTNAGSEKENDKWVAPSSFERITTKYWVGEENLYQVLLTCCADLPLLVYGRKGGRILNDDSSSDVIDSMSSLWTSELASSITSVYFDSPTMSMYTERLKRSQGSQLFRIRWYGEKKPTKDDKVFLELKTHNESWIGDSSVKERVAIRDDDVYKLLDTKSGSWDEQFASDLVRAANPDEDFQSITELSKLLLKIRTTAVKFNLTPCVRTKYTRAALQSSSNNHCRLTIDRDIMVINERGESKNSSSSSWCLDDTASVSEKDVVKLPYCVYEVKIANDNKAPPQFITDLEGCNAIVEAKKFSKFLSGVSIHNADKVATLPWWAADAKFSPLYQEETDISCSDRTANTCFIDGSNRTDVPFSVESAIKTSSTSLSTNPSKLKDIEEGKPVDTEPSDMTDLKSRRKSSRKSLVRRISSITVPIYKQNGTFEKRVAPKTRLRVEPKSHFANERTFIQWVSAALLFITFSQLFNIMASQSDNQEARIAGTWMLAMALFISVYALATYYRRVYLMRHGKPYGYIDWIGPGILTASIVSGVILLTVYTNQSQEKASVSTMVPEAGKCVRRSLEGPPSSSQISLLLELQPSGVVVDETRQMILVPTTNKIIALKDGLPDEEESKKPVEVVATLPGTDIEALELVEGKIFALSEGKHESEIIALEFGEGNQLKEIQRWKLSSLPGVEGLALVPGKHKQDPSELILAGADDSKLSVYDIDSFNDNVDSVESKTMLNSKFVANGLPDMKISDMHFFEGLLYMLFDNSRVIRAIDTNTGTIVQDIPLPVAEVGSKKQWEGMRLQRINEDSAGSGGVRGSGPASTLVLHLALDTPAQVWSLRLDETVVGQRWSLPSCAL